MQISQIKKEVLLNVKNIPGPTISRKIIVIECDDWGGIRTPSREVYNNLVKKELADANCRYRFDTLATVDDMERLYHTLEGVKDANGKAAVMTPIVNVANPDFEKIRKDDFKIYHYEKFTDTLIRYGRGEEVLKLWKEGLEKGVFVPELHGKEHLTVQLWLETLRKGHGDLLYAFDNGYVSLNINEVKPAASGFRAEFYFDNNSQIEFLQNSIKKGVDIFTETFGYCPNSFVPSNAVFHPVFEDALANAGVNYLNVMHFNPVPDKLGNIKMKYYRNGKCSSTGLTYYVRNCAFEPSDNSYAGIDSTLKQIEVAFKRRKPAIISSHRVNFVGAIDPDNRDYGLLELKKLLEAITNRWPDVEFMSSKDMLNLTFKKN